MAYNTGGARGLVAVLIVDV